MTDTHKNIVNTEQNNLSIVLLSKPTCFWVFFWFHFALIKEHALTLYGGILYICPVYVLVNMCYCVYSLYNRPHLMDTEFYMQFKILLKIWFLSYGLILGLTPIIWWSPFSTPFIWPKLQTAILKIIFWRLFKFWIRNNHCIIRIKSLSKLLTFLFGLFHLFSLFSPFIS